MRIYFRSPFFKENSLYNSNSPGVIKGQTQKLGSPYQALVRVYEKRSGVLIDQKATREDGSYEFTNLLKNTPYFLTAFDKDHKFNAVIQDNVVPK